ncbi:MAG: hypothetical protein F4X54_04800, partial [Chloroflexi bacterium]|nr:hypothetical protein [Chloroflexota bacterium]
MCCSLSGRSRPSSNGSDGRSSVPACKDSGSGGGRGVGPPAGGGTPGAGGGARGGGRPGCFL